VALIFPKALTILAKVALNSAKATPNFRPRLWDKPQKTYGTNFPIRKSLRITSDKRPEKHLSAELPDNQQINSWLKGK